jgi:predicted nucleotidyltransferase
MAPSPVVGIAEARAQLSALVKAMAANPQSDPIVIGSHRTPTAILMPYGQMQRPVPTLDLLRSKASLIRTLATAHKLSTVSVIGSVATGTAHEDSDVDLLCDTEPGTTLYDIASCEIDLEQALGFPVTIITRASLSAAEDSALLAKAVPVF